MKALDDIEARVDEALLHQNLDPSVHADMAWNAVADIPKLIAALEAVGAMMSGRQKLWDAICTETCLKDAYGIDHRAIADTIAANVEATITEALA